MRSGVLLLLCAATILTPSVAGAQWTQFIPRPLENGAFVDAFTSWDRDNNRSGGHTVHWTDTFFREKLTFYSDGYSYHPRFLQYHFSITGTARQEQYDSSYVGNRGWGSGSGMEYDVRLFLLPEHPYNLKAWMSRYEPMFKEQAATEHTSVSTNRGVSVRYRKKPYFMHASYVDSSVDSGDVTSDVSRASADAKYFKRYKGGREFSINGAYNRSWFSNSEGLDGHSDEYQFGNFVNLKWARLSSTVEQMWTDQEQRLTQKFEYDQFSWYEMLNLFFPLNFRVNTSYRYQDNDSTFTDAGMAQSRTVSDIGKELQVNVVHRLYESLDTSYMYLHNSREYSSGETTSDSHSLSMNYAKSIPRGRFLAGFNLGTSDTDNTGQVDAVNEAYSGVAVPGPFTLRQQNVDRASILVFLRSPLPPYETILLQENVDYTVTPVLNTFEIYVLTLPPQFMVPGTYDFLVSYSLTSGNYTLTTDNVGASTSLQLFDDLLTPYFNYLSVKSDVTSGTFPGPPLDSTTYTAGLIVHRGPVRARGEYQRLEWDVSPYEAWRAEVQYVASLNATTSMYATAAYLNKHYPQGTSEANSAAYTEESESVSATIQKQFPLRNMSLSLGGTYSHMEGLVNTDTYSANAAWTWTIGKVDLSVGASAYGSDSSAGANFITTNRDHQYVYAKIRRRLLPW